MARCGPAKLANEIIDSIQKYAAISSLPSEDREYARRIVDGFRQLALRQGDRAPAAALDLEDLVFASLIARDAQVKALKSPTKETIDMACKTSERKRKIMDAVSGPAAIAAESKPMGIGSRMRPLMKKAAGAIEAAIAETERRKRLEEKNQPEQPA